MEASKKMWQPSFSSCPCPSRARAIYIGVKGPVVSNQPLQPELQLDNKRDL